MKKVFVIGSGGREHAVARAFAASPEVGHVYVAPGNPGMTLESDAKAAVIETVNIAVEDLSTLVSFALDQAVDMVFVGPEIPLEMGIVDQFDAHHIPVIGPNQKAAQLENSKQFAKTIMQKAQVKTADHAFFQAGELQQALDYAESLGLPFVIKADGLMAGKGVVIPETMDEAIRVMEDFLLQKGLPILIEEFLVGNEFSHFTLVNGQHVITLGTACDYKRAQDGDQGLNTGGMGSFSPVSWMTPDINQQIIDEIVQPVADQMVAAGTPFTGILYTGLIWTADGPKVIEFNTRLGDPETQVILPLLETDFYTIMTHHLAKKDITIQYRPGVNLGVVLAAEGYPKAYVKGVPIDMSLIDKEAVYYAGVTTDKKGGLQSNGGRILMVTGQGEDIDSARQVVYDQLNQLQIGQTFYRKDIGYLRERVADK